MKSVISNQIGVDDTTISGQWPVSSTSEPLLKTLREAAQRADRQQRAVLASFTFPIAWIDPLRVFTAARQAKLGECFFWERPVEGNALVGMGAAATIETHGVTRFTDSASAWRTLLNDAAITCVHPTDTFTNSGPVLFGGYTFDPLVPRTALWVNFPDGLLILPQILLSYSADCVALSVNRMIQASDNSEQCAKEIAASVKRLHDMLERTPEIRRADNSNALSLHEIRPASEWKAMVADTVDTIQHGAFEKVVLARDIQATFHDSSATFAISTVLHRLRESYPTAYVFAIQRGEQFFMGATPERLVQARDGQIQTMALAGSARRGKTEEEDARIGAELLQSEKNNGEHAIVVEMVREALANHCTHVHVSTMPQLLKLKNVQHLKTPIAGELIPGRCILDIMADLHPTPAVGGFPRHAALEAIRNVEKLDRGWYAAPLGWIGASGHGEFAVALRSGLIDGGTARLFAGCGIVADSDPQAEFAESCLKFQAMLHALGYEERDRKRG
ncbi:MAG TPA: isochorismate synthase [Ktedonobacteraceae bacterium]|nr:isochorismate synthase [Ktedonobacteraceae bacterium]